MASRQNQSEVILAFLKKNGSATNVQLNDMGYRYAARIHELRKNGHSIRTVHEGGKVYRFVYDG